jgi:hypothetical protein
VTDERAGTDDRLRLLEQEREARRATIERIRSLLVRADARRMEDSADARRWHATLNNLERTFDEANVQLAECETRIEGEKRRAAYKAELDSVVSSVGDPASLSRSAPAKSLIGSPMAQVAVQRVEDRELHELDDVSLEEAAFVQAAINEGAGTDHELDRIAALARKLEFANQTRAETAQSSASGTNARSQLTLRSAVDKIVSGKLKTVTLEEFELVLGCFMVLQRRIDPGPADVRLREILEKSLLLFDEKFHALRKKLSAILGDETKR